MGVRWPARSCQKCSRRTQLAAARWPNFDWSPTHTHTHTHRPTGAGPEPGQRQLDRPTGAPVSCEPEISSKTGLIVRIFPPPNKWWRTRRTSVKPPRRALMTHVTLGPRWARGSRRARGLASGEGPWQAAGLGARALTHTNKHLARPPRPSERVPRLELEQSVGAG